jgi:ABC-type siderophore export system fused ATPase/permease subunit
LCGILKRAHTQTAHLVFDNTKANAEKTKRAVFCQRSNDIEKNELNLKTDKENILYGYKNLETKKGNKQSLFKNKTEPNGN